MTLRQINNLIEIGNSLNFVAGSYSELATLKLKLLRDRVEKNRQFFLEISQVYALINQIASLKGIKVKSQPKGRICLLLTSNDRFYGNVNNELTKFFLIQSSKIVGDKLVIGSIGISSLKSIKYFHSFDSLVFQNDFPNQSELQKLIFKLSDYRQILVFFPQFISVLVQKPTFKDITQTQASNLKDLLRKKSGPFNLPQSDQSSFILEPNVVKMLEFFDQQIKFLLLEETILEAELARTASRLISMDQAQIKAQEFISQNRKILGLINRSFINAKILETIAGVANLIPK